MLEGDDNRERLNRLLAKARGLPAVAGVYLMKDAQGRVLYVGKAGRLPDRVSSYFVPSTDLGPRKQPMLGLVEDFDIIECEGEWEALLAEARLIKDIRPRFNASLSDDKTFPYLAITTREDFPRVVVTREPNAPEFRGARVYGPFVAAGPLREAVQLLQRVFKFRTCPLEIADGDVKLPQFRPCILYNINQCTAPCAAKIGKTAYRDDIDRFIRFLDSKRSVMIRELREEMAGAAAAQEFEKAAVLRDQVRAIEKLDERASRRDGWQPETETALYVDPKKGVRTLQRILSEANGASTPASPEAASDSSRSQPDQPIRCIEGIDIAHLAGGETVGSKVCFIDGRPLRSEYRRYRITSVEGGNDDYASIREVVSRRYREAGAGQELYPDVILIDGGLGQLHAALEAFETLDVRPPMVISLAKKEELIYVQRRSEPIRLARENAALRLCQHIRDEAHRFAQHYHHVLRRKRTLEEE
ncbi:MAG: UvrB/UvrC motif-containing protein [Phycisphaerales bacterium]